MAIKSNIDEITLQKFKQELERRIDSRMVVDINNIPFLANEISLIVRREFYGEHKEEMHAVSFKSPLNWWEHFKHDCLPTWLLSRFPVKYKTSIADVRFSRAFEFPDAHNPNWSPFDTFVIHDNPPQTTWQ